jgi:hypothetical protein
MAPINVPKPPTVLPPELQKKWRTVYEERFEDEKKKEVSDQHAHQEARVEANRLLRVKAPTTYEEAKAMPSWQIHGELVEHDGKLRGVTVDGKKFVIPIPLPAASGKFTVVAPSIDRMNKEDLTAYAKSKGVAIEDGWTKQQILDAVVAVEAAGGSAT